MIELNKAGNHKKALFYSRKIEKKHRNNPIFLNVVGITCRRLLKYDEAKKYSLKASRLDVSFLPAKLNLAMIELAKNNVEKAIKKLQDILRESPDYLEAKANLALAYKKIGLAEKSLSVYESVSNFRLWNYEAKFNYAVLTITLLKFTEGWENYEYRWKVPPGNRVKWPIKDKPIWKGEERKHVALWREQGIGDDVIFLGLIPEVRDMCASLSVYVDQRLIPLCERSMPDISFFPDEDSLKKVAYDYHLPMGSVPGLIRNDISDFDKTVRGYLQADEARVKSIRSELGVEGKKVIGISWKSFSPQNKSRKSIELSDFRNMFMDMDIVLVNLQYGDVDQEIREFKEETGIEVLQCSSIDNKEDIDGLAALIEVCDLVVSTSNVTIHLAGALGKETWVLLPFVSNYWWLLDRKDSIWYPSLSLYRQAQLNDWNEVFRSVQRDLKARFVSQGS